jgi:hypothetical protein
LEVSDNAKTLREQGLIDDSEEPLPDEFYTVITEMTDEEVKALVRLKERLDKVDIRVVPLTASRAGDDQGVFIL